MKDINFSYYFFDENYSYRLLELLEVARPGIELTDEYIVTAIPIDTVKTIHEAGMIENIEYRPASATVLSYMLDQMPENHHDLVEAYRTEHRMILGGRPQKVKRSGVI